MSHHAPTPTCVLTGDDLPLHLTICKAAEYTTKGDVAPCPAITVEATGRSMTLTEEAFTASASQRVCAGAVWPRAAEADNSGRFASETDGASGRRGSAVRGLEPVRALAMTAIHLRGDVIRTAGAAESLHGLMRGRADRPDSDGRSRSMDSCLIGYTDTGRASHSPLVGTLLVGGWLVPVGQFRDNPVLTCEGSTGQGGVTEAA